MYFIRGDRYVIHTFMAFSPLFREMRVNQRFLIKEE